MVVGEQILAGFAGKPLECVMDAAGVERIDGTQSAAQTNDLAAE